MAALHAGRHQLLSGLNEEALLDSSDFKLDVGNQIQVLIQNAQLLCRSECKVQVKSLAVAETSDASQLLGVFSGPVFHLWEADECRS